MDPKRIVMLVVGASVMVLIFSAILVPIVNDATTTEKTFENEGYYSLTKLDDTSEATINWSYENPTVFNINGTDIDLTATGRLTILGSDSICLRYNTASNTYQVQVFGSYNGTQGYKAANASSNDALSATISGGIVTVTVTGEAPKTFDLGNDAYLLAPSDVETDYVAVMKITTENAYLLKDSEIVICGISVSNSQSNAIGVFAKGDMENGVEFSTFFVGSNYTGDVTFTDTQTYSEEVSGYKDLYALEKYTTTINYNEGSTSAATYSYFIVPAEVTAERAAHPDSATNALLSAIPIIAMIGIVLAVVGVAIVGRNDY